jgi:homoserine O-acetyltransferase
MKVFAALVFAITSLPLAAQSAASKPEPVEHAFVLHNFRIESSVVLPEAKIVYGTYGHLNAAMDNAILLPSHYMAEMHGYEWLIGPGKARSQPAVPYRHRVVWQRALFVAKQHA